MTTRAWVAGASLAVALVASDRAAAEPQANFGVRAGAAGIGQGSWWSDTRFHLGGHGDVLFGRSKNNEVGVGPYAETFTNWGDFQAGAGGSVLLPVHPYLPVVLSAGGYGRKGPGFGWEPGVSAELFWGSRSFNYSSSYVMAGGLVVQTRYGLGDSRERSIVIAAHVDAGVLALPLVLLYESIRGSRSQ